MPLLFDFNFPENLKRQQTLYQSPINRTFANNDSNSNKIDRTKWLTWLVTSPMLFPFILALVILFFTYQKIETANNIYLEQNKVIQQQKEDIIKGYKELIEQYKVNLIKDTTKK